MEKFVEMFTDDPLKAISVLAAALVVWFVKREHKHRDEQFGDFKTQMKEWKQEIADISNTFVITAREHQESLAIVQHQFRQLNQQLNYKLEEIQKYIESIDVRAPVTIQKMVEVTEAFHQKLGKILEMSGKLEVTYGKVILLQGETEEMKSGLIKHREQIGKIARYLEAQRQKDLDKDKK